MRDYELRKGQGKVLEGDGLRAITASVFGTAIHEKDRVVASFGALERITAWTDGRRLFVETTMKTGVADAVATDTIKAYNTFLERTTGYTAKERAQRAQKAAKKGTP
jgi:hypothetical protein